MKYSILGRTGLKVSFLFWDSHYGAITADLPLPKVQNYLSMQLSKGLIFLIPLKYMTAIPTLGCLSDLTLIKT